MIEMPELKTQDDLFLYLMHVIHEKYQDSAILKGGMVLRLLGSQRETLDLDYVFVPFCSKKEIFSSIEELFESIEDLKSTISMNSKAIRINIEYESLRAQVEINVSEKVKSTAISTANLKESHNPTSARIIKIMSLDVALANKMAAWNERRLLRDIFDIYYFLEVQNVLPDLEVLENLNQ
jgi:predicted nucleotidyltransferase component of viral defense system